MKLSTPQTLNEGDANEADRRLRFLQETVALLLSSDHPVSLVGEIYEKLAELLGVEFYFHYEKVDERTLRLAASHGAAPDIVDKLRYMSFGQGVCGYVAAERRSLVLEDVQSRSDTMTAVLRDLGITAYICHPLVARGELIGTLSFGTRRCNQFTDTDIRLIRAVCDQISLALERERGHQRLHDSEERLRLALRAGHMGTFDWDLQQHTVIWDTAVYEMFGLNPNVRIDMKRFCDLVHPDDRAKLLGLEKARFNIGTELLEVEYRIVRPGGELRWIASRGHVSRDESGAPIRINGVNFDITERKRAEELKQLAHQAGRIGTFYWDVSSDRVDLDRQFETVYGIGSDSPILSYNEWITYVHPDDRPTVAQAMHEFFDRHGRDWQQEFRIVRPDGKIRWIESRATVLYDVGGGPRSCFGVNVDITERRLTEEALRSSEARFRRLSESGIVGLVFFTTDGRYVDANDGFLTMIGCSRAELKAGFLRWDKITAPEWLPRTRLAIKEFNATGRIKPYEKEYLRRDGSRFWALVGSARLDDEGNGISFVVDISKRKKAEQALQQSENRFRQAFDFAPIGMVLTDLTGKYLHVNRAYCTLVGYEEQELLQSDFDFRKIVFADDLEHAAREFRRMVAGEIPAFFIEMRYVRKEGRLVWVRVSATTRRDSDGKPFQVIGLVEDITSRKQAEEALWEADRHKDNFLAALGHELRNPLAPIRNSMQILRLKAGTDPHLHWAAEVTERQVQQMTRLVDDLLDVSRINRGQLNLRHDLVDVGDVIKRSIETTAPLFERRPERLRVSLPIQPVFVRGDDARLAQIVTNLLSNAAKFTPLDGFVEVTLEADATYAVIRVRDTGQGIPETALGEIFEPFKQLGGVAKSEHAGLGLGLALVKRLVELHKGEVTVSSAGVGMGAEFRIRLPRAHELPVPSPRRPSIKGIVATQHLRIVVVDDNRDVAESLVALLQMLGHEAHPAFTGGAALETVEHVHPDLVFCDIGLPDFSGLEVAYRLRHTPGHSHMRLVAMTGFAGDSEKAIESGFDEWFLKPVDVTVLQSTLERSRPGTGDLPTGRK